MKDRNNDCLYYGDEVNFRNGSTGEREVIEWQEEGTTSKKDHQPRNSGRPGNPVAASLCIAPAFAALFGGTDSPMKLMNCSVSIIFMGLIKSMKIKISVG